MSMGGGVKGSLRWLALCEVGRGDWLCIPKLGDCALCDCARSTRKDLKVYLLGYSKFFFFGDGRGDQAGLKAVLSPFSYIQLFSRHREREICSAHIITTTKLDHR